MSTSRRLPKPALAYVLAVMATTLVAVALGTAHEHGLGNPWAFAFLTVCAALSQMGIVHAPASLSYHLSLAFVFAAVVLLPTPAIAALAILMHLPAWVKEGFPWYMQGFNIANTLLSALVARLILVGTGGPQLVDLGGSDRAGWAWAGLVAAATLAFTFVNHFLLGGILKLARGVSLADTKLFDPEHFSIDAILLCVGASIALAWRAAPVASAFAVLPLFLIFRALRVPALEKESWTDPKTGLYNARFFKERGGEWCDRAEAERGALSLLLIDLDFLREVNNQHGHLAGDAVISGIGAVLNETARASDMAARFGGEEFALLMPDTPLDGAMAVAERIREMVAERPFESGETVVRATVSIGVVCGAGSLDDLIARADQALYRAKAEGRDRVAAADAPMPEAPDRRGARHAGHVRKG